MAARNIVAACALGGVAFMLAATAHAESFTYTVIQVQGAVATEASGINDSGVVAGSYYVNEIVGGYELAIFHGFIFDHGTYTVVDPPGSASTMVTGIGNDGTIIGTYSPDITIGQQNGFILKNGVYTVFGQAGYKTAIAAISHDGAYTIGTSLSYSGRYFSISTAHHGVPGHIVLRGSSGYAVGINAQGTGIGDGFPSGYVVIPQDIEAGRPLRPKPLPGPMLSSQSALGINDSGAFVGTCLGTDGFPHGYVNTQGVVTTIDYPGSQSTFGDAINNVGDVLGETASATSPLVGFVLHNGIFSPLDGIPTESFTFYLAGLNASRQVVATSGDVVYLATPQ